MDRATQAKLDALVDRTMEKLEHATHETIRSTGLQIITDASVPENEIRVVQPRQTFTLEDIGEVPTPTQAGRDERVSRAGIAFEHVAAIRERITLALEAEIGDRATAERLAGVVVRALERGE